MSSLGELVVKLSANTAEFTGAMDKAAYQANQRMMAMERAAKQAGAAIGVALVAGAGAFAVAMKSAINTADEIGKAADRVGVTTEALTGLQYAAGLSGASAEQLEAGMSKLNRTIAAGNPAFESMGISVKDVNGNLKSSDQVLKEVAGKFAGYKDGAAKSALAAELFGKEGTKLIPMLNAGAAGIDGMHAEAEKLGLVLSKEVTDGAAAVNDNISRVQSVMQGTTMKITAGLLPTIEKLSAQFVDVATDTENLSRAGEFLATILKLLASGASIVTTTFDVAGKGIAAVAAAAVSVASGNFQQAWDILKMGGSDVASSVRGSLKTLDTIWAEAGVAAKARARDEDTRPDAPMTAAAKGAERSARRIANAVEQAKKAQLALMQEGQRVFEATRTPAEQLAAEYERLNVLLEKGAITWDTYGRAVMDAQEKLMPMAKATKVAETNIKEVEKAASSVDIVITNSFASAADAIADFAMGGKLNFGEMVNSMVRDLIRLEMQMQMTSAYKSVGGLSGIGNLLTGFLGAATGLTYGTNPFSQQSMMLASQDFGLMGRANGGYMSAGASYLVGERGPEILTLGASSGNMTPNNVLSRAGQSDPGAAPIINVMLNANQPRVERQSSRWNGVRWVIDLILSDVANDGEITQAIFGAGNIQRGGI